MISAIVENTKLLQTIEVESDKLNQQLNLYKENLSANRAILEEDINILKTIEKKKSKFVSIVEGILLQAIAQLENGFGSNMAIGSRDYLSLLTNISNLKEKFRTRRSFSEQIAFLESNRNECRHRQSELHDKLKKLLNSKVDRELFLKLRIVCNENLHKLEEYNSQLEYLRSKYRDSEDSVQDLLKILINCDSLLNCLDHHTNVDNQPLLQRVTETIQKIDNENNYDKMLINKDQIKSLCDLMKDDQPVDWIQTNRILSSMITPTPQASRFHNSPTFTKQPDDLNLDPENLYSSQDFLFYDQYTRRVQGELTRNYIKRIWKLITSISNIEKNLRVHLEEKIRKYKDLEEMVKDQEIQSLRAENQRMKANQILEGMPRKTSSIASSSILNETIPISAKNSVLVHHYHEVDKEFIGKRYDNGAVLTKPNASELANAAMVALMKPNRVNVEKESHGLSTQKILPLHHPQYPTKPMDDDSCSSMIDSRDYNSDPLHRTSSHQIEPFVIQTWFQQFIHRHFPHSVRVVPSVHWQKVSQSDLRAVEDVVYPSSIRTILDEIYAATPSTDRSYSTVANLISDDSILKIINSFEDALASDVTVSRKISELLRDHHHNLINSIHSLSKERPREPVGYNQNGLNHPSKLKFDPQFHKMNIQHGHNTVSVGPVFTTDPSTHRFQSTPFNQPIINEHEAHTQTMATKDVKDVEMKDVKASTKSTKAPTPSVKFKEAEVHFENSTILSKDMETMNINKLRATIQHKVFQFRMPVVCVGKRNDLYKYHEPFSIQYDRNKMRRQQSKMSIHEIAEEMQFIHSYLTSTGISPWKDDHRYEVKSRINKLRNNSSLQNLDQLSKLVSHQTGRLSDHTRSKS